MKWPKRLNQYVWMPDSRDFSTQKSIPKGIVIHSGSRSPNVAEYVEKEPDGRRVSYHFAWSGRRGEFVQMVSLQKRAWHAGSEGNNWIGVCLPGPWDGPRDPGQRCLFRQLIADLTEEFEGQLRYWTQHSDLSDRKKDPGPGFSPDWMTGLGLTWWVPGMPGME